MSAEIKTRLVPADEAGIAEAAALLLGGQVVGMPTETVYGLAANALDESAVERIFTAKGRPQDNPLIAHINCMDMLPIVARECPPAALRLAQAFWPGPLTMVLPRTQHVANSVCAGLDTVGVRMPLHPVALSVIKAAGVPLAAPSANLSGGPSPTTALHVMQDMQGRIPLVLDGGASAVGVESTVITLVGEPTILRPGFITPEQLGDVLGVAVRMASSIDAPLEAGQKPQSPGMKYGHYAPRAKLVILRGSFTRFAQYVADNAEEGVWALCFDGEEQRLPVPSVCYGTEGNSASEAAALFAALRTLDDNGARIVYARCPETDGVGLAVYNRLLRAAEFRVVEL